MDKQQRINEVWSQAQIHRKACKVGYPVQTEENNLSYQSKFCPCCDQAIDKEPIPLWEHTKQLQVFGFGYPLWFSFLKYCILLIIVLIASRTASELYMATKQNYEFCKESQSNLNQYEKTGQEHQYLRKQFFKMRSFKQSSSSDSIYNVESGSLVNRLSHLKGRQANQEGQDHHPAHCTSFMVYFSIFQGEEMHHNLFLDIVEFLIHLLTLAYIRNQILKEQQYYDERTTSISDYAILISNLPPLKKIRQKVTTMLQQQLKKQGLAQKLRVQETISIFKDEKIQQYNQKINFYHRQLLEGQNLNFSAQKLAQFKQKGRKYQQKLKQEISRIAQLIDKDQIIQDKVIVILSTEVDKARVIQAFGKPMLQSSTYQSYFPALFPGESNSKNKIVIKEAPEPNEIIWEHIDQSDIERKALILRGWLYTFLFLTVITIVFYFIMLAKTKLFLSALEMEFHDPHNSEAQKFKIFATIIVFVALFGVVLFNKFLMGLVLHKFVHGQKHAYTDKENYSFALKYSLGMFFTTALMTLAVQAITFDNFYAHPYGVIQEETIMFFVTAFLIPFVWFIHPYNLHKRWHESRRKNQLVVQKEANLLVQDTAYDLGKRYAQIFQIMWFTFLYCELIPLGSFLILIGLILYYCVDKYNFLRRSTLKGGISGKMTILALKALDATLFLAYAGEVLFSALLGHQFNLSGLIFCLLGILYMLLPISGILLYFNGQKFLLQEKTYRQAQKMFWDDYKSLHPVYRFTHAKEINQHRREVRKYRQIELMNTKMYGIGRSTYLKEQRMSTMKSSRSSQGVQRGMKQQSPKK